MLEHVRKYSWVAVVAAVMPIFSAAPAFAWSEDTVVQGSATEFAPLGGYHKIQQYRFQNNGILNYITAEYAATNSCFTGTSCTISVYAGETTPIKVSGGRRGRRRGRR